MIIGMAVPTSHTVVRRIRACSGKDPLYVIQAGPGMRIVLMNLTKQVREFARLYIAKIYWLFAKVP